MAFAFNNAQPSWTTAQQLWLLEQIHDGRTQREIYDDFTAEESDSRPETVERWVGKFGAFKKRLQRLTRSGADLQDSSNESKMPKFDLATVQGRYDYWVYLAQTTKALATRTQALQMIEKLAPRIRATGDDDMTWQQALVKGRYVPGDFHTFAEVVGLEVQNQIQQGEVEQVTSFLTDLLRLLPTNRRVETIKGMCDESLLMKLRTAETSVERTSRLLTELRGLDKTEADQLTRMAGEIDGEDNNETLG